MSLAEEIEAQLNHVLDRLAEAVDTQPGPERGLAWGDNGQGRIVLPLHVVAKLAAEVAERQQKVAGGVRS